MSASFCKKLAFFVQKSTITQSKCESCVRDFLVLLSVFVRPQVTVTENITSAGSCPESGLQTASNWPKLRKMTMTSQFSDMTSSSNFFWRCFVSFVKFSYSSNFHVNIITGSGVITIFFYKGFTRNRKYPRLSFAQYLEQIMDTKFGTNVSNKILLNAAIFQGYSYYRFWVIKGKPTGGEG